MGLRSSAKAFRWPTWTRKRGVSPSPTCFFARFQGVSSASGVKGTLNGGPLPAWLEPTNQTKISPPRAHRDHIYIVDLALSESHFWLPAS